MGFIVLLITLLLSARKPVSRVQGVARIQNAAFSAGGSLEEHMHTAQQAVQDLVKDYSAEVKVMGPAHCRDLQARVRA